MKTDTPQTILLENYTPPKSNRPPYPNYHKDKRSNPAAQKAPGAQGSGSGEESQVRREDLSPLPRCYIS